MCYQNVFAATFVQPSLNRRLSVLCAYRILRRVLSFSLTALCVIRIHAFVPVVYRSLGPPCTASVFATVPVRGKECHLLYHRHRHHRVIRNKTRKTTNTIGGGEKRMCVSMRKRWTVVERVMLLVSETRNN